MNITNEDIIRQLKLSLEFSQIKKKIIAQEIIRQKVQEEQITISDRELQKAADTYRVNNNLLTADATMNWIEKNNLDLDDFETIIYQDLLVTKLAKHLFNDQIEAYFYEHQIDYQQAAIYEIILDNFDLAMELYFGIQEKEFSFWEIAHQYIRDLELRRCRGYQGILKRTELKPEISAAVFAAKPPQIIKPITVDKQTYLILVEEIIQPELNENLRQEIRQKLYEQWLQQELSSFLR